MLVDDVDDDELEDASNNDMLVDEPVTPPPMLRQPTVEDVPEDDDLPPPIPPLPLDPGGFPLPQNIFRERFYEEFHAGATVGVGKTQHARFKEKLAELSLDKEWAMFQNKEQCDLACYLMETALSQGEIDRFLKLDIVCTHLNSVASC